MRESEALVEVRLEYGQAEGFVVWRNTSGFVEHETRKVRYGVGVGGSDLLGITPGGLFLAVEVKGSRGRPTEEQLRFLELVYERGGVACLCHDGAEARGQISAIRAGFRRHF